MNSLSYPSPVSDAHESFSVQEWREPEASIIATKTTMPFEKSVFKEMVKAQFLPNDSPAIFYHRKYTTPKLNIQRNGTLASRFLFVDPVF